VGPDQTVGRADFMDDRKADGFEGKVLELMPSGMYRIELMDLRQVLGHLAGATKRSFVRLRVGDRVEMEISPHDVGRGRITKLLGQRI